jgi:hypothetical protein
MSRKTTICRSRQLRRKSLPSRKTTSKSSSSHGKQIKGPKGLKDGVLMHADYTRKTQEVASERKALAERAALVDQQAKASEEELSHRVQMSKIDSEIERFKGFEWAQYQALRQTDPAQAEEAWAYKQHLNNLKNDTKSKLDDGSADPHSGSAARPRQARRGNGEVRSKRTSRDGLPRSAKR